MTPLVLLFATSPAIAAQGGLYVATERPGATVLLDGLETGQVTPVLLENIDAGTHVLQVVAGCQGTVGPVVVEPDRITRADLRLQPATGKLVVSVETVPARVTVDGVVVGEGSSVEVDGLVCGEHALRVEATGHHPVERRVEVGAFREVLESVVLEERLVGTLVVAPTPLEATVLLDGAPVAKGPVTIEDLDVGSHALKVSLDGYVPATSTVDLLPDEIKRLDVSLVPVGAGTALVGSPPPPAWKRNSPGRIVTNTVVTAGGLALGGLAVHFGLESDEAYQRYLTVAGHRTAEAIYEDEVAPARTRSIALGVSGGVLLLGGGALWVTTDFTGAGVRGRW